MEILGLLSMPIWYFLCGWSLSLATFWTAFELIITLLYQEQNMVLDAMPCSRLRTSQEHLSSVYSRQQL
jgi:hypothetical protein